MAKANDKKAAKAPAKAAPAKAAAKAAPAAAAKPAPMSRGDVVDTVAAQVGLTRTQADDAMKAYEGAIQRALVSGGEVRLPGFGTFKTGHRDARPGRNPQTGEAVTIAASTTVKFSASAAMKDAVNGNKKAKAAAKAAKAATAPAKAPPKRLPRQPKLRPKKARSKSFALNKKPLQLQWLFCLGKAFDLTPGPFPERSQVR